MLFPSGHPGSLCAPVNVAAHCSAETFLEGVELADMIAIVEMRLEGDTLIGESDDGIEAIVEPQVRRDSLSYRTLDRIDSSCSKCGEGPVCAHGVATLLSAHGYAGIAGRLVEPDKPRS